MTISFLLFRIFVMSAIFFQKLIYWASGVGINKQVYRPPKMYHTLKFRLFYISALSFSGYCAWNFIEFEESCQPLLSASDWLNKNALFTYNRNDRRLPRNDSRVLYKINPIGINGETGVLSEFQKAAQKYVGIEYHLDNIESELIDKCVYGIYEDHTNLEILLNTNLSRVEREDKIKNHTRNCLLNYIMNDVDLKRFDYMKPHRSKFIDYINENQVFFLPNDESLEKYKNNIKELKTDIVNYRRDLQSGKISKLDDLKSPFIKYFSDFDENKSMYIRHFCHTWLYHNLKRINIDYTDFITKESFGHVAPRVPQETDIPLYRISEDSGDNNNNNNVIIDENDIVKYNPSGKGNFKEICNYEDTDLTLQLNTLGDSYLSREGDMGNEWEIRSVDTNTYEDHKYHDIRRTLFSPALDVFKDKPGNDQEFYLNPGEPIIGVKPNPICFEPEEMRSIVNTIHKHGFVLLKGVIDKEDIHKVRKDLKMNRNMWNRRDGEFDTRLLNLIPYYKSHRVEMFKWALGTHCAYTRRSQMGDIFKNLQVAYKPIVFKYLAEIREDTLINQVSSDILSEIAKTNKKRVKSLPKVYQCDQELRIYDPLGMGDTWRFLHRDPGSIIALVPLTNFKDELGEYQVCPGTHQLGRSKELRKKINRISKQNISEKNRCYQSIEVLKSNLFMKSLMIKNFTPGDVLLMDSNLLYQLQSNSSFDKSRVMLYFTYCFNDDAPFGRLGQFNRDGIVGTAFTFLSEFRKSPSSQTSESDSKAIFM